MLDSGYFLLTPSQYKDHALAQASTVIFLSNAYFWSLFGYFSPTAAELPLLHTWSLAVEEHFYLVYPVFIMLLWRIGRLKAITFGIILMALISIGISEWGWRHKPEANYFFSLSRFWELLAGGMCSLIERKKTTKNSTLAWLGLAILIGSPILTDESVPTPSFYTLPIIVGSALLILYARDENSVAKILSRPVATRIGMISYSAYLWHQPVFAFSRIQGWISSENENSIIPIILISIVLLIAWISWKTIEQTWRQEISPIKYNFGLKKYNPGILGLVVAGILFAGGAAEQYTTTVMWRHPIENHNFLSVSRKDAKTYLHSRARGLEGKKFTSKKDRRILVIGDSYAKDLINALYEADMNHGLEISYHSIPSECGNLFLDKTDYRMIPPNLGPSCENIDRFNSPDLLDRVKNAHVIILASRWQSWQVPLLEKSISRLNNISSGRIVFLNTKNLGRPNIKSLSKLDPTQRQAWRQSAEADTHQIYEQISSLNLDNLIDVQRIFCEGNIGCKIVDESDYLLSEDGSHLTKAGAKLLGLHLRHTWLYEFLQKSLQ